MNLSAPNALSLTLCSVTFAIDGHAAFKVAVTLPIRSGVEKTILILFASTDTPSAKILIPVYASLENAVKASGVKKIL